MTKEELYYLSASELLKYIQAEKERLIKEKIIKKSKTLLPITEEEKPYELPKDWEWARLENISTVIPSKNYQIKTNSIIENGLFPVVSQGKAHIDGYSNESSKLLKLKNPVIIFGDHTKIVKYIDFDFIVGADGIKIIDPLVINPKYLYFVLILNSNKSPERGYSRHFQFLNKELIPLPPLYIQDQIVQKLEQLSETKESLLLHTDHQLNYTQKMRKALLQEAIRGELVSQDENDEPALVLLEKIKADKELLIKEKIIKKPKALPPITDEEKTYELPVGWEWVRLGEIIELISGRDEAVSACNDSGIGIPYIMGASNMQPTGLSIERWIENPKVIGKKEDIMVSVKGTVGKLALIDFDEVNLSRQVMAIRRIGDMNNKYLMTFMRAYVAELEQTSKGVIPGISRDDILLSLIPIPPLAEQERIVAKLDELMANCDQLEAKAEKIKNYTIKLFEASLKEAFMPE